MRQRRVGGVLAAAVLVATTMAGASARAPQNAPADTGAALLDEVKALRADVREAAGDGLPGAAPRCAFVAPGAAHHGPQSRAG